YQALKDAREAGLNYKNIAQCVFEKLNLPLYLYSKNYPIHNTIAEDQVNPAFRNVLGYMLYQDLRRGWRIVMPNLEQCGLLKIEYQNLEGICSNKSHWEKDQFLANISSESRFVLVKTLLDLMRRKLIIDVPFFDKKKQNEIADESHQYLSEEWRL